MELDNLKNLIDPSDEVEYDFETEDEALEHFYDDGELGYCDDPDIFLD